MSSTKFKEGQLVWVLPPDKEGKPEAAIVIDVYDHMGYLKNEYQVRFLDGLEPNTEWVSERELATRE